MVFQLTISQNAGSYMSWNCIPLYKGRSLWIDDENELVVGFE